MQILGDRDNNERQYASIIRMQDSALTHSMSLLDAMEKNAQENNDSFAWAAAGSIRHARSQLINEEKML